MLDNKNIYKEVYFLNLKDNAVCSGRLTGTIINEAGYIMHVIFEPKAKTFCNKDDAVVFYSLEEAQKALIRFKPINDSMVNLKRDTDKKLDEMRETINGKPHFLEYIKLVKQGM